MSTNVSPAPVQVPSSSPVPDASEALALSRRRFLRTAAVTGTGLVAVGLAACAPSSSGSTWSQGPSLAPAAAASPPAAPASAAPSMAHGSAAPSTAPSAGPTMDHDANAKAAVERFLGGEGASMARPGNVPLEPRVEDGVKVFELTIEEIDHPIDAEKEPVKALGFNGTWPGPRLTVVEGDRVRATFTNNLRREHGHPLPRPEAAQQHGRRAAHHPGPDPAGRVVHLRVRRTDAGLAHVPLAPQRDRPGRARAARRVHRRAEGPGGPLRPAVRRDPGHRLDQQRLAGWLHDQRPRLPGDVADRRDARRHDRHPLHERGRT